MTRLSLLALSAGLLATTGALAQDFVAAGTELEPGQAAIVPHLVPEGPQVPIELTITAIEEGDVADLADFEMPPELEGSRPYYVRFDYTNLGEEDLANQQIGGFVGIDGNGEAFMPSFTMGGESPFSACSAAPPRALATDANHEGCVMFLIDADTELASVGYRGNYRYEEGKDTEADFPIYYDPVLWTAEAAPAKGKVIAPQG